MLTKTLTAAVVAALLAYAGGALAHGISHYNKHSYHGSPWYGYPYGNPGWSFSFSYGSRYRAPIPRYYYDHGYRGSHRYIDRRYYIPPHAAGPACDHYGYHRH